MGKEPLENRLQYAIGFIRTVKNFAKNSKDKKVCMDEENLQIIYDLLVECKEKFVS